MPYLIIGVDPGNTVGVAALDLAGRPVRVAHLDNPGMAGVVSIIESWGTPSLIASDVRPAPELVSKLASAFHAALYVPVHPWREEDKKKVAREVFEQFSFPVSNAHERDALSAAVQAWRHHQNLLRLPSRHGLTDDEAELLRHLLLQGFRHDVAMEKIRLPKIEVEAPAFVEKPTLRQKSSFSSPSSSSASSLRLQTLERTLVELRKSISMLEAERERLSHRIRLLENGVIERQRRDYAVRKMAAEIMRLRDSLRRVNERKQKDGAKAGQPPNSAKQASHPSGPSASSRNQRPAGRWCTVGLRADDCPPPASKSAQPPGDEDLKELDVTLEIEKIIEEYRRSRQKGA